MEQIEKKKFTAIALDSEHETFIVYIAALSIDLGDEMYLLKRTQIAYLKVDEALIKIPSEYADFADVFFPKLGTELPKYPRINDHAIVFVDDQQLPYGPIYNLSPVELEILKAYIKNNLANGFIRPFKSPAKALILFDKKLDSSLRPCIDY